MRVIPTSLTEFLIAYAVGFFGTFVVVFAASTALLRFVDRRDKG